MTTVVFNYDYISKLTFTFFVCVTTYPSASGCLFVIFRMFVLVVFNVVVYVNYY